MSQYFFIEHGSSNIICSDTYAGPRAFSEIETSSLSSYISSIASRMDVYLSFHSYSQLLLLPYGHTVEHLDNYDEMVLFFDPHKYLCIILSYLSKY